MSKHAQRSTSTTLILSALLLVASAAWAAKPGGGGTGGGTPAGWIHYSMQGLNSLAQNPYRMRADGSGKALSTWILPSNLTHQGVRWFLDVQPAPHEDWSFSRGGECAHAPYSGPSEVVLTDGLGTTLWLTGDPSVQQGYAGAWAADDDFVSFFGLRRTQAQAGAGNWTDALGVEWVIETQFFRVWIDWSATPPAVSAPELLNVTWPFYPFGCDIYPDVTGHSWSPDHERIVLSRFTADTTHIVNAMTGDVSLLASAPACSSSWSPNGQRIAYDTCWHGSRWPSDGIYTVNPDGTGLLHVISGSSNQWYDQPKWSPDSMHLAFRRFGGNPEPDVSGVLEYKTDIYRVPAIGGSQVNLTRDLPDDRSIQLLGWVQ